VDTLFVANLEPQYFKAILSGKKDVEHRYRERRDPRIDGMEEGDLVLFRECRTERALLVMVLGVTARKERTKFHYRIRFGVLDRDVSAEGRKAQGWQRYRITGTGVDEPVKRRTCALEPAPVPTSPERWQGSRVRLPA
jgi:ASC-1-like (ASCH) protein